MGAVFEAVDERFGTPVAIKEILIELEAGAAKSKRDSITQAFEREAKALANARHEAVPFVRDFFAEGDSEFLVMELVDGDELGDLLKRRERPFEVSECLDWLDQLLDALDYLHSLDPPIIHRDIKPQNLKLNSRGRIKLLDFGIAKSTDITDPSVTNHTFLAATQNYSPIEQLLRVIDPTFKEFIRLSHKDKTEEVLAQATDARCDIYALGATIYHLLTGRVPADSTKRAVELWSGKDDPLLPVRNLIPDCPVFLSDAIERSMALQREDRFASAARMREALRRGDATSAPELVEEKPADTMPAVTEAGENFESSDLAEKMRAPTEVLDSGTDKGTSGETPDTLPNPTDPGGIESADTFEPVGPSGTESVSITAPADDQPVQTKEDVEAPSFRESDTFLSRRIEDRKTISAAAVFGGSFLVVAFVAVAMVTDFFGLWRTGKDTGPDGNLQNSGVNIEGNTVESNSSVPAANQSNEREPELGQDQPTPSPTPSPIRTRGPVSTPAPSPAATRTPSPTRTPTPTRSPKKQDLSDDCIYNGKCN